MSQNQITKLLSKQKRIKNVSNYTSYPIEELRELIDSKPKEIGFDFETTGLNLKTLDPVLLGITNGTTKYIIDFTSYSIDEVYPYLLELKEPLWIAHNAKFDIGVLKVQFDLPIEDYKYWCTMVASQIRYNGAEISHSYADCVERHFKVELSKDLRLGFVDRDMDIPIKDQEIDYLNNDLEFLIPLKKRQVELLNSKKMLSLLEEIENPFLQPLVEMEIEGIRLDTHKWQLLAAKNTREKDEIKLELKQVLAEVQETTSLHSVVTNKARVRKSGGTLELFKPEEGYSGKAIVEKINPSSSVQIKRILELLKVNLESTEQGAVERMLLELDEENYKVPRSILTTLLKLRKKEKLVSTYGLNFLNNIDYDDFKIRTEYTQAFTDTGRLSSRSPNLQNIPSTKEFRECFVPDSTDYKLVTYDFSQQELRIATAYSEDQLLLANFQKGLDLHSFLAQKSFRLIRKDEELIVSKEVNEDLRDMHKPVLFGYIYGATGSRVGQVLNVTRSTGTQIIRLLSKEMPRLSRYQKVIKQKAVDDGIVFDGSRFNRIKQFRVWRVKKLSDHQIEKQGANFPIQGTAASMTKEAIVKIYHYLKDNNVNGCIKLQVHDEIVLQLHKDELHHAPIIKNIMEEVGTSYLRGILQMKASMNISDCWQK